MLIGHKSKNQRHLRNIFHAIVTKMKHSPATESFAHPKTLKIQGKTEQSVIRGLTHLW